MDVYWLLVNNSLLLCFGQWIGSRTSDASGIVLTLPMAYTSDYCLILTSGKNDNNSAYRACVANYYYKTLTNFTCGWYRIKEDVNDRISWLSIGI